MSDFNALKEAGNALLKSGDLEGAVTQYTGALAAARADGDAAAVAVALSNRSLTLLRLGRAQAALDDARACVAADPQYKKGSYRVEKAEEALAKAQGRTKGVGASTPAATAAPPPKPPSFVKPTPAPVPVLMGHAKLKAEGNAMYAKGQYAAAEALYSKAVDAVRAEQHDDDAACGGGAGAPSVPALATYLGNRSSARLMLGRFDSCAADCAAALAQEPPAAAAKKLRLRHASALAATGALDAAKATLLLHGGGKAAGVDPKSDSEVRAMLATLARIQEFLDRGDTLLAPHGGGRPDHSSALRAYTRASEAACKLGSVSATNAAAQGRAEACWPGLAIKRARCLTALGQHTACGRAMQRVIEKNPRALEAYEVRAEAFYGLGQPDQAIKYLQHVLRSDPDCSRAAKRLKTLKKIIAESKRIKEGIAAAEGPQRDPATAEALCTEGLALAPDDVDAKVWYSLKRATLRQRLARLADREASPEATTRAKELMRGSLRDVGVVTYHDERCVAAFPLKAAALQSMGLYQEAVDELEVACKTLGASGRDPETRPLLEALQKAKFELRKSKRLDIYALLDLKPYCTPKQVRAYALSCSTLRFVTRRIPDLPPILTSVM